MGASLVVLTAYAMGWDWLQRSFLYIPLGVWAVALAGLAAQYHRQQLAARTVQQPDVPERRRFSLDSGIPAKFIRPRLPSSNTVSGVLELVGVPSDSVQYAKRKIESIGSRVATHGRAVRIGVDLAESDARVLMDAGRREDGVGAATVIEWVRVPGGLVTDVERDLVASNLDVLIRRERRGDINLFVREDADHPAAWQDWGLPMPLGYPAVFPQRVDPARVALTGCDLSDDLHCRMATQMILACAMMSRLPGRVGAGVAGSGVHATKARITGLVTGRHPMPELSEPDGPLCRLMQRLSMTVEAFAADRPESTPLFAAAAARVVGAWLTRENPGLAAEQRARVVAAAADLTSQEAEGQLRLAAANFAAGHEDEALNALKTAAAALRRTGRRCDADPLAFVMSEIELGQPDALTLGRVAAGLGLLWATSPEQNLAYLREDLLDDLSHAGWLAKRPGDVELLQRVVRMLDGGAGQTGQRAAA